MGLALQNVPLRFAGYPLGCRSAREVAVTKGKTRCIDGCRLDSTGISAETIVDLLRASCARRDRDRYADCGSAMDADLARGLERPSASNLNDKFLFVPSASRSELIQLIGCIRVVVRPLHFEGRAIL